MISIMAEQLPRTYNLGQTLKSSVLISQSFITTAQTPELSNGLKFFSGALNNRGEREENAQFHRPPPMTGTSNLDTTSCAVFSACCCVSPVLSLPEQRTYLDNRCHPYQLPPIWTGQTSAASGLLFAQTASATENTRV